MKDYNIYNNIEGEIIFTGNEDEFIHFVRKIAVENHDDDMSIIRKGEAEDYIFNYCDNLELVSGLEYYKRNAEEGYMKVPISVHRYISELEKEVEKFK